MAAACADCGRTDKCNIGANVDKLIKFQRWFDERTPHFSCRNDFGPLIFDNTECAFRVRFMVLNPLALGIESLFWKPELPIYANDRRSSNALAGCDVCFRLSGHRDKVSEVRAFSDIQSGIDCMRCSQTVFDSLPVFTGNKGAVDVGFDGMRFSGWAFEPCCGCGWISCFCRLIFLNVCSFDLCN